MTLETIDHVQVAMPAGEEAKARAFYEALLGLPEPIYHHHKLIVDGAGRKLSKSTQATGLRELRAAGSTALEIRRTLGLGR